MKLKITIPNDVLDRVIKRICEKYEYPYAAWNMTLNADSSLPDPISEADRTARLIFAKDKIRSMIIGIIKEKEVSHALTNTTAQAESLVDKQINISMDSEA